MIQVIYEISNDIKFDECPIRDDFKPSSKEDREKAQQEWDKFIKNLSDDFVRTKLRFNKNGQMSKIQPKTIFTASV